MTSNPIFIMSLLISSFLAFFIAAEAVDISISLFRIVNNRIRSTLRLLPFLSLIVDVLFNQYSFTKWINPFSCASCGQKFILETFFPQLNSYLSNNHVCFLSYIGTNYGHALFTGLLVALSAISVSLVARQVINAVKLTRSIKTIRECSVQFNRPIYCIQLARAISKYEVQIYISDKIKVPLAYFKNVIIIPAATVELLTQQEIEAVIAHELEHIRHMDPTVRLFYYCIASIFWWVPTHSWIKAIEQEQELSCDQNALNYDLKKESVASALVKVAKQIRHVQKSRNRQSTCYLLNESNPTLARIQAILGLKIDKREQISIFNFLWAAACVSFLLICFIQH